MSEALFELADYAPQAPEWALACIYCVPDILGRYREDWHLREHLAIVCEYCGATSANRQAHERDHGAGRTWTRFGYTRPICTSLQLRINQGRIDAAPYLLAMEGTA